MNCELFINVVKGGYCIGCGACTTTQDSPYAIKMNGNGCYEADRIKETIDGDEKEQKLCPFYESDWNEDTIANALFSQDNYFDAQIGYFKQIFVGRVKNDSFYRRGSSGGIAKWILRRLLEEDLVDYVIQVYNNENYNGSLFEYRVVSSPEEVDLGSKSAYYPVEMSKVLEYIKNNPGRYAITGVPCFVKSIRLLQLNDPFFNDRIKYSIGIFCGHLKSKFYADMLGWQLGVNPNDLSFIDFRVKIPGKRANEKGVQVKSKNGLMSDPEIVQNIFGTNYGHGFFKYIACDYCDDVIAETADVSVGDAWLPEFMESGKSMVVIRNQEIFEIINRGIRANSLDFWSVDPEKVIESQQAGYRHRREGLSFRLDLKERARQWVPRKRISSGQFELDKKRKDIYTNRLILSDKSYSTFKIAYQKNDFLFFKRRMTRMISNYSLLNSNKANLKIKFYQFLITIGIWGFIQKLRGVLLNFI